MTHIIAFTNEKGGVAKTTTVLSLAGALVETGRLVLLVDLDAQANLTLGLGVNPAIVQAGMAAVLSGSASLSSVIRDTGISGLSLAPANTEMVAAGQALSNRPGPDRAPGAAAQQTLARALEHLQRQRDFDTILLDCPPSLGIVTLNALAAAHLAIIPTQPEYFSVHGLRGVLAAIRSLRSAANPHLNYRVLITLFDRRNRIHHTLSEQLRLTFGEGVFNTVIEIDTKLRESTVIGYPITHSFPRSRSATQYRLLAEELILSAGHSGSRSASQSEPHVEARAVEA